MSARKWMHGRDREAIATALLFIRQRYSSATRRTPRASMNEKNHRFGAARRPFVKIFPLTRLVLKCAGPWKLENPGTAARRELVPGVLLAVQAPSPSS
jgi:hypothetical protein